MNDDVYPAEPLQNSVGDGCATVRCSDIGGHKQFAFATGV